MDELNNLLSFAWQEVEGFPGYFVSPNGLIKSTRRKQEKLLTPATNHKGYLQIAFCIKYKMTSITVHQVVAQAFIPNPDNKPQVNHKNGVKTDNRVDNLEWATNQDNVIHSYEILGRVKNTPPYKGKKVRCVETDVTYNSAEIADRAIGLGKNNVSQAARGVNKTAGGYRWEYV